MPVSADANLLSRLAGEARLHHTPCGSGRMAWRVWGRGEPLVLLHGATGFWGHWCRNIEPLAQSRELWIPDLPGWGDSDLPATEDHAGIVDPVALGLATLLGGNVPRDVVGFSTGGVMAAHLASRHPALVRRIVVIGSGGIGTPLAEMVLQPVWGTTGAAREAALRANLLAIMLHHPESADDLALAVQEQGIAHSRIKPRELVMPDHLVTALARCDTPLDAIWGAFDGPHPDPASQEQALRPYRPDMRFKVVPEAGHWCMYERPAAFNAALRELL